MNYLACARVWSAQRERVLVAVCGTHCTYTVARRRQLLGRSASPTCIAGPPRCQTRGQTSKVGRSPDSVSPAPPSTCGWLRTAQHWAQHWALDPPAGQQRRPSRHGRCRSSSVTQQQQVPSQLPAGWHQCDMMRSWVILVGRLADTAASSTERGQWAAVAACPILPVGSEGPVTPPNLLQVTPRDWMPAHCTHARHHRWGTVQRGPLPCSIQVAAIMQLDRATQRLVCCGRTPCT